MVWTNDPELFDELGLAGKNIMLWKVWLRKPEMFDNGVINHAHDLQMLQKTSAWQEAEKIFLMDTEGFLPDHMPDDGRVHIWDSTVVQHPRIHPYWFWMDWNREIESYVKHGNRCYNRGPKPYMFDAFLGKQKPARDIVWEALQQLGDNCLKSYTGNGSKWITGFEQDRVDNMPNLVKPVFDYDTPDRSIEGYQATYHDRMTGNVSSFVPWQVYQQSWYTLVTETHHNRLFVTEKTIKPLLGRRVFVMLHAAPGHLRLLRDMGIKTFSDIIDENYDDIEDFSQRLSAALEQCKWLAQQDHTTIYSRVQERLEHNRGIVMNYNGLAEVKKQIKELIQ